MATVTVTVMCLYSYVIGVFYGTAVNVPVNHNHGVNYNSMNATGNDMNGTLTLGVLIPWEQGWLVGPSVGSAFLLGLDEVRRRQLLPGYQINWLLRDDYCAPRRGMQVSSLNLIISNTLFILYLCSTCYSVIHETWMLSVKVNTENKNWLKNLSLVKSLKERQ